MIQANGTSQSPAVSSDGRYVAFVSLASNLLNGNVSADTNGVEDVFLADTVAGTIRLVSAVPGSGASGNGPSTGVDISGDGRYVAFASDASNLVPGDVNGTSDVFRFDAVTGGVELVSRKGATGAQGGSASENPSISKDGALVAFTSRASNLVAKDTNNQSDAFVRDVGSAVTTRVSTDSSGKQANGGTFEAAVCRTNLVVAFSTTASNLVNADPSRTRDVYVKVLGTGKTSIASVRSDESRAPATPCWRTSPARAATS